MSSIFVLKAEHAGYVETEKTAVLFLPLDPGNYLVLAKGKVVAAPDSNVFVHLDVRGADGRGDTDGKCGWTYTRGSPNPKHPHADDRVRATFELAVAVTLTQAVTPLDHEDPDMAWVGGEPAADPPGARLFARREGEGSAVIDDVRIIALQADHVSIVEAGY